MSADDALAEPMRRLGDHEDHGEGARMLGRLANRMFAAEAEPDRIARFELRERIGAGAMGVVYEAWDPELDRCVAIKLLRETPGHPRSPNSEARLLREAKAMARLRHPNVISIHEVGTHAGQVFLAMERIEGSSLREWLGKGPRSWAEIVEVFIAAGRGLAAAHAAGLVHRDFKPDNLLIEGRRVFVGDFGLAAGEAVELDRTQPVGEDTGPTTLTRTGALVGTPAYMAPEALARRSLDARADQYSFCVALSEALYGRRPWAERAGDELHQLRAAKSQTLPELPSTRSRTSFASGDRETREHARRRDPSRGSERVPRWLRAVLLRGLAADPERRFPSMDALIQALERGHSRTRLRRRAPWIAGPALGLAAALTALLLHLDRELPAPASPPVCAHAGAAVDRVWSPARRQTIAEAFAASEAGYAEALGERTLAAVDAHAEAWARQRREACEATHLRGVQSSRALDLRMRCLDRRLAELDALLARFEQPSAGDIERSRHAVDALTPLRGCAEVELLESTTPLPEAPKTRAAVAELRADLDEVYAAMATGQHAQVAERSVELLDAAEALAYKPAIAEAAFARATILSRLGEPAEAEARFEQAIVASQASGYDEMAARAMISAIHVVGFKLRKPEAGERYIDQGRALLERIGDPPERLAAFEQNRGTVAFAAGDFEAAKAHLEAAIELLIATEGEDHHAVAEARSNLAAVERRLGHNDRALALYAQARAAIEASLGPDHPSLFNVLNNTGVVYLVTGRDDEAEATLREAIALAERSMPAGHASVGHPYNNLGELLHLDGRHAAALAAFDRAVEIWTEALGPEHALLAHPLTGRGYAQLELEHLAAAQADLRRAVELRRAKDIRGPALGQSLFGLARALDGAGERERAVELAGEALAELGEDTDSYAGRAEAEAWLRERGVAPEDCSG